MVFFSFLQEKFTKTYIVNNICIKRCLGVPNIIYPKDCQRYSRSKRIPQTTFGYGGVLELESESVMRQERRR